MQHMESGSLCSSAMLLAEWSSTQAGISTLNDEQTLAAVRCIAARFCLEGMKMRLSGQEAALPEAGLKSRDSAL